MAPEAIQNSTYSEYSDVFSFAITVCEIYAFGDTPYKDASFKIDERFWVLLLQDIRPNRPTHMNDHM